MQLKCANDVPAKLKILCLQSIKRNIDFYLQQEQSTEISPFDDLPSPLRIDMLGTNLEKWGKWEQLMMNCQVTNLALSLDLEKRKDDFVNFCASMIAHKPQIKYFKCGGFYKNSRIKSLMPLHFIATSGYFDSLQSLTLSGTFSDDRLQMIATYLKHLRVLKLKLGEDCLTGKGIIALSTLEHLVEFHFTSESRMYLDNVPILYNMCLKVMPKLQVIAEEINLETVDNRTIPFDDRLKHFHIKFEAIPKPTELGLRQLVLSRKMDIPAEISMPNVTSLCLWGPLENFQLDATRFKKVTSLGLLDIGMENCLNSLKILGHQITLLTILEEEEDLTLDLILRLCPKLEKFHIGKSPKNLIFDSPLEPEADLQNLKELRIVLSNNSFMRRVYGNMDIIQFSPGALVQLLKAPRLRWLRLCQVNFSNEEFETITKLVKKGQMLKQLKELEVENRNNLTRGNNFYGLLNDIALHCPDFVRYERVCPEYY